MNTGNMRVVIDTLAGRRVFDNVELLLLDERQVYIRQPNVGNKKGSRTTILFRSELKSTSIVYTSFKVDIPDTPKVQAALKAGTV